MPHHSSRQTFILRALAQPAVHIALLLLSGLFAYSNTFNVPFLFDDNRVILDNHLIKNLGNFWPPSGTRWFGTLTFALNYAAGELHVSGYHYANLAIHLAASLLVYRLVDLTFRTPLFLAESRRTVCESVRSIVPFVASFLFVSHPVQTQAVTYIAQRYASLATLLFLAATFCYIQARLAHVGGDSRTLNRRKAVAWYAAALVWTVLAMNTKEIAFTLPFVIMLYEFSFLPGRPARERLHFLAPVALTLFIIPLILSSAAQFEVSITTSASELSRHDYLLTQFRVIVTYLRLLVLPVSQMLDYAYPIFRELSDPPVFLSLGLLSSLFLASFLLLLRGRNGTASPELCIIGFGGMWFFITLSVESSIIPITDVIFEHRLYLPSAGAFMAAAAAGAIAIRRLDARFPGSSGGACAAIAVILLLALPVTTHFRNKVWRSELALWEDVASKSPGNARALANIGAALIDNGNIDQAIVRLQEAIRIRPDYADALICLGNAYLDKGMLEEGYRQFLKAFALGHMDSGSRAELLLGIGNYNFRKGELDLAIGFYRNALVITPYAARIHYNLGRAFSRKGMAAEAADEFAQARRLNTVTY